VLKAEVGRPTVEAIPADPTQCDRAMEVLGRFGEPSRSQRGVAVQLRSSDADLAAIVRAIDSEELKLEHLQLHQPSLDDVFLAKTGRSLEGAAREEETGEQQLPGGLATESA
jgi:ABC-2 type transport system ATP-binding protein